LGEIVAGGVVAGGGVLVGVLVGGGVPVGAGVGLPPVGLEEWDGLGEVDGGGVPPTCTRPFTTP